MKIKLLIFLGLALVGIHGMSAPADVPAMDGWTDALDVAIGKHKEYVAVREARIEALRQQLVQVRFGNPGILPAECGNVSGIQSVHLRLRPLLSEP